MTARIHFARPFSRRPVATAIFLALLWLSGCTTLESPPEETLSAETAPTDSDASNAADSDAAHADIFQRMREGFSMPDIDDDLVLRHQEIYLGHPGSFRLMVARSRPYLYHIVEEIEKRGMPTELALLPMVESAYDPMAYSRSKASGLWQFIPSTGRYHKLEQNWWLDERRDILASTSAALTYFEALYERHGDWHLALASYNWGGGAVGKAIAKNQDQGLPTDYRSLSSMPEETRNYVPKLQALKNIFRDPELLDALEILQIPNAPYFDTIDFAPSIDVKLAASLAELSEQEFFALNPAHNRPVIVSKSPILLPEGQVGVFAKNIREHIEKKKPLSSWQLTTLRAGETLDDVARRFDMTLIDLTRANDIGKNFTPRPGLSLLVRGNKGGEPLTDETLSRSLQFPESERDSGFVTGRYYTIRKGDTLPLIARRTGVSVKEIRRQNKLRGDLIIAGKRLVIPRPTVSYGIPSRRPAPASVASSAPASTQRTMNYTIRPGDTLTSIARQYRVAVDDLMRWNRVSPTKLRPGMILRIVFARMPRAQRAP
ncbi:MAG: LysM peptidoglycan-binding domain-containing protein [Candidatus Accumulibacter sp.]|jgi:membrane-bound lytic murein transglycosylase D|nr:LysM peptidoglycan-binding domain-containing protein [Accumulibacter sp.]